MQIAQCVRGLTAATIALMAFSAAATAQPPPGGGGFGQGGFRGGGPGFGGGPGGFGMGRNTELTLVNVPLTELTAALRLTEDQQARVKAVQDALQQQRQEMMSSLRGGFGGPGGGGQGGPGGGPGGQGNGDNPGGPEGGAPGGGGPGFGGPGGGPGGPGGQGGGFDPQAMQQRMQQMQEMQQRLQTGETSASRRITALLSDDQRAALTPAMREWKIVQQIGLPLEMTGQIRLTEEQKTVLEKYFATRGNGQQGRRRMQIQGAQPQGGQQ